VSARGIKTNLVEAPSSLVGRVGDRAALSAFFDNGARLVTLLGPGGVGKTRIATRFALEQAASWSAHGGGGAWFCDLTEARSAMAICAVVAAALGLPLDRNTSESRVAAVLGAALARRGRLLIVLDNFEQLIGEAAATVGAWLIAAPGVRFLVTSRIALGLPCEQLAPLAGLSLPSIGASLEGIERSEAVQLFVRRARQVRPELSLPNEALRAIAELVRRLDGLPLAIELAAARVTVLSPAQLRDRWGSLLDLLVRPGDNSRHGSMRAAVLDSVQALSPQARACFAGSAIFRGGFSLASADEVLRSSDRDVMGAIEELCAHSLLRTVELGGEPRFVLYEALREVALEQLAAAPAERDALALRHAIHYHALGRTLGDDDAALARRSVELENLVEAQRTALSLDTAESSGLALGLALALDPLLATRGLLRLRLRVLDDAILATDAAARELDAERAAAFVARGHAHRELGALDPARADLERGLALAQRAGDRALEALALVRLGEIIETSGATAAARAHFERALEGIVTATMVRRDRLREADIRAHLGHAWRREGRLEEAQAEIGRALARYRADDHAEGIAAMCYEAGVIALFHRRYEASRAHLEEGVVLARARGARQLEAAILSGLGVLVQEEGKLDEAIVHHVAAVQIFRDLGHRHREGSALYYLASAYLERGEPSQAMPLFLQAADAVRSVGAPRYEALIHSARGAALAMSGDRLAAEVAFAAAEQAVAACASEPSLRATIDIHRMHLSGIDVSRARALVAGQAGDDPQLALRLALGSARPKGAALIVRAGAAAFRLPGASEDVDVSRRQPLRRLVAALARRRVDAPGESVALEELIEAGWPGERVRHEAAVNRVHVALTTLRKLGLRELLVSGEHGYLLSPAVPVAFEEDE